MNATATILIAEDDEQFSYLLGEQLRNANYEVTYALDGLEALDLFRLNQPDLVLLDIMMPRVDGWEALRQIRQISDVPVILVSCRSNELDKVRGLEMGADDYITKPISRLEFMARVGAVLRRGSQPLAAEQIVQIDDRLVVDQTRQEAFVEGQPAGLSAIEYKLLACLLDNANRICPHQALLTQVWGWEYTDEVAYLKVYIHHLRQKLEPEPGNPRYILTERGKGYCFQMPARL
ncbi:MAG: response regulator transcription factor [Anaerolineae bacterium]|jgi:two-component system KDP operon response regulator KdpE